VLENIRFHNSKFSSGVIDADTVKATHFGGFDEEEEEDEGDGDEVGSAERGVLQLIFY
jgi:hypothetical protein